MPYAKSVRINAHTIYYPPKHKQYAMNVQPLWLWTILVTQKVDLYEAARIAGVSISTANQQIRAIKNYLETTSTYFAIFTLIKDRYILTETPCLADNSAMIPTIKPPRNLMPDDCVPLEIALVHRLQVSPQIAKIAIHLAQGKDTAKIAEKMNYSTHTVQTYIKRLFDITDTHSQAQLVGIVFSIYIAQIKQTLHNEKS